MISLLHNIMEGRMVGKCTEASERLQLLCQNNGYESEISVQIESRIESAATIRIRIEYQIESV